MSDEAQPPNSAPPHDARVREFMQLLAACERRLYDFVLALVGNFADADEISQETKLRLWEQFADYRRDSDFGAWACTIARYQVLDHRKRTNRQSAQFSTEFYEVVAAETARRGDDAIREREQALLLCVERLSGHDRDLLLRCYEGQTPIKQIAQSLGRSTAGTYQLLWRIRNKLHRCIQFRLAENG